MSPGGTFIPCNRAEQCRLIFGHSGSCAFGEVILQVTALVRPGTSQFHKSDSEQCEAFPPQFAAGKFVS